MFVGQHDKLFGPWASDQRWVGNLGQKTTGIGMPVEPYHASL